MENKEYQFNNESEIVSKYIVEKLISLTINKVFTNHIFNKGNYSNYLLKFCRRVIDPIIKVNFMNYDIDDLFKNSNTWNNILEPEKIIKDVDLSNLIFINEYNNNKTIKELIEPQRKSTFLSNSVKSKSTIIPKNNKQSINDSEIKKEKKLIKLNLPSYNIVDLDKKKESSEIKLLRAKIELELKEKKKKLNESLENKYLNKINKKIIKLNPIDSNKYTFDSNGNIILLKKINYQQFKKEFNDVNSKNTFIEYIIPNEDEFYSYNIKNKDKVKVETVSAKIFPKELKFSKKKYANFSKFY